MFKNHTWNNYAKKGVSWNISMALAMAILHFVAVVLYGVGAYHIGKMGTSLGFAAFLGISIIIANLFGFITGEWKGAGVKPVRTIIIALLIIIVSME